MTHGAPDHAISIIIIRLFISSFSSWYNFLSSIFANTCINLSYSENAWDQFSYPSKHLGKLFLYILISVLRCEGWYQLPNYKSTMFNSSPNFILKRICYYCFQILNGSNIIKWFVMNSYVITLFLVLQSHKFEYVVNLYFLIDNFLKSLISHRRICTLLSIACLFHIPKINIISKSQ